MRILSFTIGLLLMTAIASAQVIPVENRVNWEKAGCRFSFPEPHRMVNVMDYGAHADGLTDDNQAFTDAIAALNGRYGMVFIPAGTYLLESGISLPDSVIFRGAGSDSTLLKINSTGTGIGVSGSAGNPFVSIISGYLKDSKKITVNNSSAFTPGEYVEIRQENGSWDTQPASWATYCVGQISRIASIYGDTLFLEDSLRISFDPALNPEVRTIIPTRCVSIECLTIERTNASVTGTGYNLSFNLAAECRVRGVESNKSQGSHCMISLSSQITITGCYFHEAYVYDGSGTKGYGVTLISHSGNCLIINNIFRYLRHAMMTKQGANGNIFAYNYSREVHRVEWPQNYGGDISLHGHYSFANLFEGNIVQNLNIDDEWGPSGPFNTFFRNRTEAYGMIMTTTQTNYSNFVGSEIMNGYPYGAFTITGTGNFLYCNNKNGTIIPTGTDTLSDLSYYYSSVPPFWNISDPWPGIGAPNAFNSTTIPAKARYLSGIFTDCSDGFYVGDPRPLQQELSFFPNPVSDFLNIVITAKHSFSIDIFNSSGCQVSSFRLNDATGMDVRALPEGIYLARIRSGNSVITRKFIKD